ncbi:MAG: hypothetical protein ILP07_07385 [Treponema sp.]|nr:hypothetical protein [Treponema sp.]
MKKIRFLLLILVIMLLGCTKKEPVVSENEDDEEETVEIQEEKITNIPCVMLGDYYYEENPDGGFSPSLKAVMGSPVQALPSENDKTKPVTKIDEAKNTFVRIILEDDIEESNLWAVLDELAVNAHPGCTYETGSDIFIFENPDFESQGKTKLSADMILAIYNETSSAERFPDADKFQKIKIRLGNLGTMTEGFLKNMQLDKSPERVTLIQVSKKYSELLESGTASNEVLSELSDTIEELRQWSDRRW